MNFPMDHRTKRQLERAERQVKNKISSFVWGLILAPIFFCVFASVVGGIIWYVMDQKAEMDASNTPGAAGSPGAPAVWNGVTTFECGGNDNYTLSSQTATLTVSPAIRANGNCQLLLMNMNITAPVVIEARANAQVNVVGGSLNGAQNSVVAAANAQVSVVGATVTGAVDRSGAAQVSGIP
jgi:hypothetical protein